MERKFKYKKLKDEKIFFLPVLLLLLLASCSKSKNTEKNDDPNRLFVEGEWINLYLANKHKGNMDMLESAKLTIKKINDSKILTSIGVRNTDNKKLKFKQIGKDTILAVSMSGNFSNPSYCWVRHENGLYFLQKELFIPFSEVE